MVAAVAMNQTDMVRLLIDRGADPTARNIQDESLLAQAIGEGSEGIVRLLLEKRVKPDASAIEAAVLKDDLDDARLLVAAHADIKGADGAKALASAAELCSPDGVRFLLENGANPNTVADGRPPLIKAIDADPFSAAPLSMKMKPVAMDSPEYTAEIEAGINRRDATIDALIRGGADVNARDIYGETPLMHAAAAGDEVVVRTLLANGARADMRTADGRTALDFAKRSRSFGSADVTARLQKPLSRPSP